MNDILSVVAVRSQRVPLLLKHTRFILFHVKVKFVVEIQCLCVSSANTAHLLFEVFFAHSVPIEFRSELLDLSRGHLVDLTLQRICWLCLFAKRKQRLFETVVGYFCIISLVVVIEPFPAQIKLPISIRESLDLTPRRSRIDSVVRIIIEHHYTLSTIVSYT